MKKKGIFTGCFTLLTLVFSVAAFAGSLDAPSAPGATGSYTLEDIWNRLNDGTDGVQSTFTEPGAVPGSTGYTIDDVMSIAPAKDDTNGATPADVLSGKTFWGLKSGSWGPQTGIAASLPTETLRKTGQTQCWDASGNVISCAGTGQDGELQKGASIANRFTPNGDGTVTDNVTGLIWLKNANCAGAPRVWASAFSDVASLNSAGTMNGNNCGDTGNHTDWRLPTINELRSLIHFGYVSPALSNDAGDAKWGTTGTSSFTAVRTLSLYWSATTFIGDATCAWALDLRHGTVGGLNKTMGVYFVWPVR